MSSKTNLCSLLFKLSLCLNFQYKSLQKVHFLFSKPFVLFDDKVIYVLLKKACFIEFCVCCMNNKNMYIYLYINDFIIYLVVASLQFHKLQQKYIHMKQLQGFTNEHTIGMGTFSSEVLATIQTFPTSGSIALNVVNTQASMAHLFHRNLLRLERTFIEVNSRIFNIIHVRHLRFLSNTLN